MRLEAGGVAQPESAPAHLPRREPGPSGLWPDFTGLANTSGEAREREILGNGRPTAGPEMTRSAGDPVLYIRAQTTCNGCGLVIVHACVGLWIVAYDYIWLWMLLYYHLESYCMTG